MSSANPDWRNEVLTQRSEIEPLRQEWEALFLEALEPCPFVTPYWLLAWWDAFAESTWEMRLVTVRYRGQLVGVLPAFIAGSRVLGLRTRTLRLWEDPHSNRIYPILHREYATTAALELATVLRDGPSMRWRIARLGSLPEHHPATKLLRSSLDAVGLDNGFDTTFISPHRSLPATWQELQDEVSKSFRKTLLRKRNSAIRHTLVPEFSTDGSGTHEILAVDRKTWQHANGTGIGSTGAVKAFYQTVIREAGTRGELRIALLRAPNNECIAFELNLVQDSVVYNLKVGYDPTYEALSPGLVLRQHVLRQALESRLREVDFLGDTESYKTHWVTDLRPHGEMLVVRSFGPPRAVFWGRYRLRPWLQRHAPWLIDLKRRLQGLGSR